MAASNNAAWLVAEKAHPFEIKENPIEDLKGDEMLLKNHAISIQPFNGYVQKLAFLPLTYPLVMGEDVAGEVAAVGPDVTRFQVGDRVVAAAMGFMSQRNSEGAFQEHTIVHEPWAARIPSGISYDRAAVLPIAMATAATAMFLPPPMLGMARPSVPAAQPRNETVIVWGGASAVGSNAIQLAIAAGYEVVTTASPGNFDYVKRLGARHVFDYHSESAVADILAVCKDGTIAGVLDCVGAQDESIQLAKQLKGNKFVASTKPPKAEAPEGVTVTHIRGLGMMQSELGAHIYSVLQDGLKAGSYAPAPDPQVVGHGIEYVQEAVELVFPKGVSAKRLVVTL